jgi:ferritin-like protein
VSGKRVAFTTELIVHILGEEIEHEDEFENLMS